MTLLTAMIIQVLFLMGKAVSMFDFSKYNNHEQFIYTHFLFSKYNI